MQFSDSAGAGQKLMRNTRKGPLCKMRTTLGLRCPLTEPVDAEVYVDGQRMLSPGGKDAHADLEFAVR